MDADFRVHRLDRDETFVGGDLDDIFAKIARRRSQFLYRCIARHDQRPFEFHHQRATRRQRDNVIAFVNDRFKKGSNFLCGGGHRRQVTILQFWHTATGGIFDPCLHTIMGKHIQRGLASRLVVEIAIAGRVDCGLAPECRSIGIGDRTMADILEGQRDIFKFGEMRALVYAGNALQQPAGQSVLLTGCPIGNIGDGSGQLGVAINFGQLLVGKAGLALAVFDRPVAEHQMGEIEIKFMRRHIRAFDHETHVAERTGIDNILDIARAEVINFLIRTFVDQVKELRKTVAEIETATAPVADVEDATQFLVQRFLIIKGFLLPRNWVPYWCAQAAFRHDLLPVATKAETANKKIVPPPIERGDIATAQSLG